MIVWGLIVMTTFLPMDSIGADGVHGPGYVGCFPSYQATEWTSVLTNDEAVTNVNECVDRCKGMNKTFAVIAMGSCYCSNSLPSISKANDSYCNAKCNSKPCQICGAPSYYSVYNTTERLQRLNCWAHCRQNGPSYRPTIHTTMPSSSTVDIHSYTFTRDYETSVKNDQDQGKEKDSYWCQSVWLRIVIDVVVILGVLSLLLLIFLTVRYFHHRQSGMIDEWKPRSFGQTGHGASRSLRAGDDLLNRNLSGSSTLDRGLESLDQVMVASGGSAVIQSLDDDRRHGRSRHDSSPTSPKEVSVSTANPRAITLNSWKLTGVPLAVKNSTPGDSEEGYYHDPEFLTPSASDHGCSQHVPSEPKNRETHSSKTSQEEYPNDTMDNAKVKDAVLDNPKRRSLLNIITRDCGKPSSQEPSLDEGVSPKGSESFLGKTWGCRYGKIGKKKTKEANERKSSDISGDEKSLADRKPKTLPNDIYAVPNKPASRNKQRKERSNFDASPSMKSGGFDPESKTLPDDTYAVPNKPACRNKQRKETPNFDASPSMKSGGFDPESKTLPDDTYAVPDKPTSRNKQRKETPNFDASPSMKSGDVDSKSKTLSNDTYAVPDKPASRNKRRKERSNFDAHSPSMKSSDVDPNSKTLPNDTYAVPNKPTRRNKQRKERSNFDASPSMKSGDVDPKSETLPNDTYAVPNKPASRNKQRKERSDFDASQSMESGDVEFQDGYSSLSRLFAPRGSGSKSKGADDTTSMNKYSALQPDSKDTDYGKLGQGDTDGPFDQDNNKIPEKPDAETYASINDTEYAEVGEVTPEAPPSEYYEMIPCGQKGRNKNI